MREIHFFENEDDEKKWARHQDTKGIPMWIANDYTRMKFIMGRLSKVHEDVITTQMSFLSTEWFKEGFRIFVHDHTGTFEIVLGEGNERTDREIRLGHSLFNLWRGGEFRLREDEK